MIFLCYRSLLLSFFIFFINKIFSQSNETEETIRYVIIVHGTINVRALKDFKKIFSLWYGRKNDLEDQYFFETINLRWQKENQFDVCSPLSYKPGIDTISLKQINEEHENALEVIVACMDFLRRSIELDDYIYTEYLVENWDGVLSEKARKNAGKQMLDDILNIDQKAEDRGFKKRIYEIIGFSHGGNVALYMAAFATIANSIYISILILVGTPINKTSIENARLSFFKVIYNIRSVGDWVQTFDIFSTPGWYPKSQATFGKKCEEKIHDCTVVLIKKQDNKRVKKMYYGHQELGGLRRKKNMEDVKVPFITFIPLVITYGELLKNLKNEMSIIVDEKNDITSIDLNGMVYALRITYRELLFATKKFLLKNK